MPPTFYGCGNPGLSKTVLAEGHVVAVWNWGSESGLLTPKLFFHFLLVKHVELLEEVVFPFT